MAVATTNVRIARAPGVAGRLLRDDPLRRETATDYMAAGGYQTCDPEVLLAAVGEARLRGRGGAAFPAAVKLAAVRGGDGPVRYVVANGEEGEPASWKDRYLLRMRPHLVLDGLWQAASIVGAARAHVYVSDPGSAQSVHAALAELDRDPPVPTVVTEVESSYVAGEESAVVRAIDAGPAKPTVKPPRPYEVGIGGAPTLVQNVETLAHLALIAARGAAAHLAHGTPDSTGTCLLTVSSPGGGATVLETPFGVPLRTALEQADRPPCADLLVGGFFGGLLPAALADLPLTYDAFAAARTGLGCGAIVVLGDDDCPVAVAADVMGYFAAYNADQCGSCVKGTAAMRDRLLGLATASANDDDVERLRRWSQTLRGRGACGVLDAAAQLARSLLEHYPSVVAAHLSAPCPGCRAGGTAVPAGRFAIPPSALLTGDA